MSGPRPAEGAFGALPALNTSELGRNLLLLSEVDSTNRYLKDNGGELPHGTVCCTDRADCRERAARPGMERTARPVAGSLSTV